MNIVSLATFFGLVLICFLLTVWALVDVSMKTFASMREKIAWWLVALIPFIGWLIYLIFGFRRGKKAGRPA